MHFEMNKIVILTDSVNLFEHYISDDKWEKTLAFPRGGLTYLISNGTIKFYAYEDYLYRNALMSMQLPIHIIDEHMTIDGDYDDIHEITNILDRIFPTQDIDAQLDEYLTRAEGDSKYQPKGDYALKSEIPSTDNFITDDDLVGALEDYYTKEEVDDKLDDKLDASAYTPTDLSGYATQSWVNNQGYLTQHQELKTINGQSLIGNGNIDIEGGSADLSNYYNKQEVDDKLDLKANASDLSALNTTVGQLSTTVENKADKSEIPSLNGYATEQWVENKNYLTTHQPLKTINNQSLIGEGNITISGEAPDLTNYYTKTEVDNMLSTKSDTSNTYTKTEITEYITNLQNQITVLSETIEECCGGEPEPEQTQYRWVNIPITDDYVCVGYAKYYKQKQQVSNDYGKTWSDVEPLNTQTGSLYQKDSADCGYVSGNKIVITNDFGETKSVPCDGLELVKSETVTGSSDLCISKHAEIGECVERIGDDAFSGDWCLTSVTIPTSVSGIGAYAFSSTQNLTSITIPDSVKELGTSCFSNSGIKSISMPTSIIALPNTCFASSQLEEINLPNCSIIWSGAFYNCKKLKSITLPNTLMKIDDAAFKGCTSLTSITITTSVVMVTIGDGKNAFDDTNNCPIYVPSNKVDAYKADTKWSKYADRIQAIQ